MGSPNSPIFAELFMQRLEFQFINTMTSIKFWYRYEDYVYSMVSTKDIDRILAKLNDFNQSISFTHEIMSNNSLPFLDTLVKVRDDFTFSFSIYRKIGRASCRERV